MIKKYDIDYDWKANVVVEVDHSVLTDEKLHEINNFWCGSDDRLYEKDGSVLEAVLCLLAGVALQIQLENNYNTFGVVSAFDWDDDGGVEGWPKMDGTHGIKIINVSPFEFDASDMKVKTIDSKAA